MESSVPERTGRLGEINGHGALGVRANPLGPGHESSRLGRKAVLWACLCQKLGAGSQGLALATPVSA